MDAQVVTGLSILFELLLLPVHNRYSGQLAAMPPFLVCGVNGASQTSYRYAPSFCAWEQQSAVVSCPCAGNGRNWP